MADRNLDNNTAIAFQQDNPKRKGTMANERYEKYKRAKTVGEALRLGAVKGDIPNDLKRGHLSLVEGAGPAHQAAHEVAPVSRSASSSAAKLARPTREAAPSTAPALVAALQRASVQRPHATSSFSTAWPARPSSSSVAAPAQSSSAAAIHESNSARLLPPRPTSAVWSYDAASVAAAMVMPGSLFTRPRTGGLLDRIQERRTNPSVAALAAPLSTQVLRSSPSAVASNQATGSCQNAPSAANSEDQAKDSSRVVPTISRIAPIASTATSESAVGTTIRWPQSSHGKEAAETRTGEVRGERPPEDLDRKVRELVRVLSDGGDAIGGDESLQQSVMDDEMNTRSAQMEQDEALARQLQAEDTTLARQLQDEEMQNVGISREEVAGRLALLGHQMASSPERRTLGPPEDAAELAPLGCQQALSPKKDASGPHDDAARQLASVGTLSPEEEEASGSATSSKDLASPKSPSVSTVVPSTCDASPGPSSEGIASQSTSSWPPAPRQWLASQSFRSWQPSHQKVPAPGPPAPGPPQPTPAATSEQSSASSTLPGKRGPEELHRDVEDAPMPKYQALEASMGHSLQGAQPTHQTRFAGRDSHGSFTFPLASDRDACYTLPQTAVQCDSPAVAVPVQQPAVSASPGQRCAEEVAGIVEDTSAVNRHVLEAASSCTIGADSLAADAAPEQPSASTASSRATCADGVAGAGEEVPVAEQMVLENPAARLAQSLALAEPPAPAEHRQPPQFADCVQPAPLQATHSTGSAAACWQDTENEDIPIAAGAVSGLDCRGSSAPQTAVATPQGRAAMFEVPLSPASSSLLQGGRSGTSREEMEPPPESESMHEASAQDGTYGIAEDDWPAVAADCLAAEHETGEQPGDVEVAYGEASALAEDCAAAEHEAGEPPDDDVEVKTGPDIAAEELESGPDTITLCLRFGLVMVKQEPVEEDQSDAAPLSDLAAPSSPSRGAPRQLDIRQMLRNPGQNAEAANDDDEGDDEQKALKESERQRKSQLAEQQQQQEQLEAAQTASYDGHKAEKKAREVKDRQLVVEDGDVTPLESRDPRLLDLICESGFELLQSVENREVLWRYVIIQDLATKWYHENAKNYFVQQRERLATFLEQPDVDGALHHLRETAERAQAACHAMPEKGQGALWGAYCPELFAPRGNVAACKGLVELD